MQLVFQQVEDERNGKQSTMHRCSSPINSLPGLCTQLNKQSSVLEQVLHTKINLLELVMIC